MSVGGIVVNVIDCGESLWVNTRETHGTIDEGTAIYVKKPDFDIKIQVGDMLWWQSGTAYWTARGSKSNKDIEVELEKMGHSHGEFSGPEKYINKVKDRIKKVERIEATLTN